MNGRTARLVVAPLNPVAGSCELCAADPVELTATVVVYHSHGGTVRLMACDRCTRAMRRVVAAIGEHGAVEALPGDPITEPPSTTEPPLSRERLLIREVPDALLDTEGRSYVVRVYGAPRADGTWAGWIELEAPGSGVLLRTERETTQSNQQQLAYWSTGLEPAYFQGAFARAR
jgi:hypothetical protein